MQLNEVSAADQLGSCTSGIQPEIHTLFKVGELHLRGSGSCGEVIETGVRPLLQPRARKAWHAEIGMETQCKGHLRCSRLCGVCNAGTDRECTWLKPVLKADFKIKGITQARSFAITQRQTQTQAVGEGIALPGEISGETMLRHGETALRQQ